MGEGLPWVEHNSAAASSQLATWINTDVEGLCLQQFISWLLLLFAGALALRAELDWKQKEHVQGRSTLILRAVSDLTMNS